jgi:hypothetical protein
MFRLASVLVLGLVASLTTAQDKGLGNTDKGIQPPPDAARPVPDLRTIAEALDRLERAVRKMDEDHVKFVNLVADRLQLDINNLRDQVSRMQREMDDLRNRSRVSESRRMTEPAGNATLLLVNAHAALPMDVNVNGVMHSVQPGQSLPVTVPAGNVSFQVMQTDAFMRVRPLPAGVTHLVTMR